MAGVKISDLPAAASTGLGDIVPSVQAGTTVKDTVTQIMNVIATNIMISESQVTGLITDLGNKVNRSGDTMTGALTLSGPPTLPLHAADKAYVDASMGSGINNINIVRFASSGSYTPSATMHFVIIEMIGGGGGGGGAAPTPGGYAAAGGGGASGVYLKLYATAAQVGAGIAVVIGALGAGGSAGGGAGGTGGSTTIVVGGGATWIAGGGGGGNGAGAAPPPTAVPGGTAGAFTGGSNATVIALIGGNSGAPGFVLNEFAYVIGGNGGSGLYGGSSAHGGNNSGGASGIGNTGSGGGGGAIGGGIGSGAGGGNGATGFVIITEYIA